MTAHPNIKVIIWDLGNVLVRLNGRQGMLLLDGLVYDEAGKLVEVDNLEAFLDTPNAEGKSPWHNIQHGFDKESRIPALMQEYAGLDVSPQLLEKALCTGFELIQERQEIFHALIAQGKYESVLLSDTVPVHIETITKENPGLLSVLPPEKLFYSYDIGAMKKFGPESYLHVLATLNVRPDEVLMIDDSKKNMKGAHDAGIHFALVQPDEDLRQILRNDWGIDVPDKKIIPRPSSNQPKLGM